MAKNSKLFPTKAKKERVVLASVNINGHRSLWSHKESLLELGNLTSAVGGEVVFKISQNLKKPNHTYLGSGKLEELSNIADFDTLICDDELTPTQQRNLETTLNGKKVLDRTALILDVFATRAQTSEGRLQVELAQNEYLLPRLQGQWSHLERLGGGIGTRGPGETQIETDRRLLRNRISKIKSKIEDVRRHRNIYQNKRISEGIPVATLVGYTNAGKSTFMNALTNANVIAENKPFSTLDTVTRQITLKSQRKILISDTVGLIQKLPSTLIAAFRATLEEINLSKILIHVIDITDPKAPAQWEVAHKTFKDLGISGKPTIVALNKIDKYESSTGTVDMDQFENMPTNFVYTSALKKIGFEELLLKIDYMI